MSTTGALTTTTTNDMTEEEKTLAAHPKRHDFSHQRVAKKFSVKQNKGRLMVKKVFFGSIMERWEQPVQLKKGKTIAPPGKIDSIATTNTKNDTTCNVLFWNVEYDDGDMEDFTTEEAIKALKLYEQYRRYDRRNKLSISQKKKKISNKETYKSATKGAIVKKEENTTTKGNATKTSKKLRGGNIVAKRKSPRKAKKVLPIAKLQSKTLIKKLH